jgi:UDP-N-acetylglucosamine--N-acetylmuramyl-(pentapeptide) pyrophosphoryl-undecaprenol N-acetylglucosamine transferase
VQLIWQTGKLFTEQAKAVSKGKANIWTNDFITRMEYAFAAADVVVSRAGAMSVAELCVVNQAVIFVPYPFAAEDHQTVNAQQLVQQDAAILVKDSEAKEQLADTAISLAKDEQKQQTLRTNIARLAITNADEIVANEILKNI